MQQQKETRLFTNGLDSDTAIQLIPDGALLNSVNARCIISQGQASADIQFIEGNTYIADLASGTLRFIMVGKAVDEANAMAYLFMVTGSGASSIFRYSQSANAVSIFFDDSMVDGSLGFDTVEFLDASAANGLLIWVQKGSEPRYLDTDTTYSSATPITQAQLSLVTEPPVVPLEVSRDTNPAITTNLQPKSMQFMYRFVLGEGFQSVLSPYSLTALPVRQSELNSNSAFGNVIDLVVDFDQKIPVNWRTVEFAVRFIDSNTFFVIKQFNVEVTADVIAVDNHNNGIANLSFLGWSGETLYAIDSLTASKPFDNIPIDAAAMELADNRLLLANIVEGYDGALIKPSYSIDAVTYVTDDPASVSHTAFMIMGRTTTTKNGQFLYHYAVIIRTGGLNFLLPRSFSVGSFLQNTTSLIGGLTANYDGNGYFYNLPERIYEAELIELAETGDPDFNTPFSSNPATEQIRNNLLTEGLGFGATYDTGTSPTFFAAEWDDFDLVAAPEEFGPVAQSRAFSPNNFYDLGIQFYDGALRKPGIEDLETFTVIPYGPFTRTLTERIDFTISNFTAGTIPEYATQYSIAMSKQQKSQREVQFVPNILKVAIRNINGDILLAGHSALISPQSGYDLYGLAVPIQSIIQYGYGYEFTPGDFVELVGINPAINGDTSVISGNVITTLNGYVIITYDSSKFAELDRVIPDAERTLSIIGDIGANTLNVLVTGATYRQDLVFATLYNGIPADQQKYEIAQFGAIVNPGTSGRAYGNFYFPDAMTASIYGDTYTQKRTAETGSATGVSITTYETAPTVVTPVNDTGRATPVDLVGQQSLPTAIRWSNPRIPGTRTNGYATFDPIDIKIIEQTTGDIVDIILTTKGVQDGGQLVILCTHGSYVGLVGKEQVYNADTSNALTVQSAKAVGTVNPITGGWGCQSPRSAVEYQGKVWWVDYYNKSVIEFNASGCTNISQQFKAARLWLNLGNRIPNRDQIMFITSGVNPYAMEVIIGVPSGSVIPKTDLPTTTLPDPLDCYYPMPISYIYNWGINKWIAPFGDTTQDGTYPTVNQFFNIGFNVYSVTAGTTVPGVNAKLYREFTGSPGVYNGVQNRAIITVPFNGAYPAVKSPLSLRVSCTRPPDETWVVATDGNATQVASVTDWVRREGDEMAAILRNRLSNNAGNVAQWNAAGVNGWRLKGKAVQVVLVWEASGGAFTATSATLDWGVSGGH